MKSKIKFYKNRLAVNFLANSLENGKEVYDAIDGYSAIGILSNQFENNDEGIEYIKNIQEIIPCISVGLGAGDPKQFKKAAFIAGNTDPGHVNQVFTGAGYAAGILAANNYHSTAINVLISPTGVPGKVKISTGELSSKENDAIIDVETAMAMILDMQAHSIKFYPMGGLAALEELKIVAAAAVKHGITMIEPTGGINLENFKEISKICLDTGDIKVMPHIYGAVIDKKNGNTKVEDVRKIYEMMKELLK